MIITKKDLLLGLIFIISSPRLAQAQDLYINAMPDSMTASSIHSIDCKSCADDDYLVLSSWLGTQLLQADSSAEKRCFMPNSAFFEAAGYLHWSASIGNVEKQGSIWINPGDSITEIDLHLAPENIQVGPREITELISTATDEYGNPMPNGTPLDYKVTHQQRVQNLTQSMHDMIAVKELAASKKSGDAVVTVTGEDVGTKAGELRLSPGPAAPFSLQTEMMHSFADGHQILYLTTTAIKDLYGNSLSDGTHVDFFATGSKSGPMSTTGITINGVANGSMIHPEEAEAWQVWAKCGDAKSNIIELSFDQAVKSLPVKVIAEHLRIGPIYSFGKQFIPDGFSAQISIRKNETAIYQQISESREGWIDLDLTPFLLTDGNYHVTIEAGGIIKETSYHYER